VELGSLNAIRQRQSRLNTSNTRLGELLTKYTKAEACAKFASLSMPFGMHSIKIKPHMKTIETRIYDGNRAREVLENEVFQAVWTDIEKEWTDAWMNSPARDEAGREKLYQYVMTLRKLKAQITTTLETGQLAQLDLQHKQTMADRVKAGVSSWLE
jgi:hypothetical protein